MLSLFGTAIGAGVLFLPIGVGTAGILGIIMILILALPTTFFAHRGLSRFVLSAKMMVMTLLMLLNNILALRLDCFYHYLFLLHLSNLISLFCFYYEYCIEIYYRPNAHANTTSLAVVASACWDPHWNCSLWYLFDYQSYEWPGLSIYYCNRSVFLLSYSTLERRNPLNIFQFRIWGTFGWHFRKLVVTYSRYDLFV